MHVRNGVDDQVEAAARLGHLRLVAREHDVPGADHFLVGRTKVAVDALDAFVATLP